MGNTNGRLVTAFKILYFVVKKTTGRFGAVFKILCFVVKNEMAVWLQFQNFAFRCIRTNGRLSTTVKFRISLENNEWPFGYNFKILYFVVKI